MPTSRELMLISDYKKFRNEPSVESRAVLVRRISEQFINEDFSPAQRDIALDILDVLSYDVEKNIRAVIAHELKECDFLPRDIALRLAHDIEEVSAPILQFSTVLSDDDLAEVIESCQEAGKIEYIAKREHISSYISDKIVDTQYESAIATLVQNNGAEISDDAFDHIMQNLAESSNLLTLIVARGNLSAKTAEKLITLVSDELKEKLQSDYKLTHMQASPIISGAIEQTVVDTISTEEATTRMVDHLHRSGKLNHSIILRALCKTDTYFFILGIARLANVPFDNAKKLIEKGDDKAYAALFEAAGMPSSMTDATKIVLRIIKGNPPEQGMNNSDYSRFLISQIVKIEHESDIPNLRYFITLLGNNCTSSAQPQALN